MRRFLRISLFIRHYGGKVKLKKFNYRSSSLKGIRRDFPAVKFNEKNIKNEISDKTKHKNSIFLKDLKRSFL